MNPFPLTLCASLMLRLHVGAVALAGQGVVDADSQRGAIKEVTHDFLFDRIYGAWVGMLIGGLEGLPHEFKYKEQPRDTLPEFTFLEHGAHSDDDNDFEWTHLWFMDKEGVLKLPYPRLVEIWKANMNEGIWVANKRARELMDQGIVPPDTGSPALNPHAGYNLSGQFCVETYGMIAPAMPQVAADLGIHYASIAVSGEPLQAAQYWTSLISLMAFHEGPLDAAIDAAFAAVDPASAMAEVVADARHLHWEHRDDWKAARKAIHAKWVQQKKWNLNSTPANGALVLLALLYGLKRREFGAGISANVDAMARFGLLWLRGGQWNGAQLLPSGFVQQASTTVPGVPGLPVRKPEEYGRAADHYGLLWWNNADGTLQGVPRDTYWTWGLYDSLIVVMPALDVVVARAGQSWKRTAGADHYEVLKPFFRPIVGAASPKSASGKDPSRSLTPRPGSR